MNPAVESILEGVEGTVSGALLPRVLAIVVLVLAVVAAVLGIWLRIARLERDKALLQVKDLANVVEVQNERVEQWKRAADFQAAKVRTAQREALRLQAQAQESEAQLLAAQVPRGCSQAVEWGSLQAVTILEAVK